MLVDHSPRLPLQFGLFACLLVAGLSLQVATGSDSRLVAFGCFLANLVSWGVLLRSAFRKEIRVVGWVLLLLFTLTTAVIFAPATSKDVNSYAAYGRMVVTHHISPYTHSPIDIPADPWFPRVSSYWNDSPTVYGPVFTALSAGVMKVAGTSFTVARLGFQLIDLIALLIAIWLVGRVLDSYRLGIALIGLNPFVLTFGLNDAHCDVLIGSAILLGGVLVARRRFGWAGVALGVAVMIKISAFPALVGALVWTWTRYRWRHSFRLALASALVVGISLFAAGGVEVLKPLGDASERISRFSIWNPIQDLTGIRPDLIGLTASACVAFLGMWLIWRYRYQADPYLSIAGGLVAYQLLGAYVLSWYALWALLLLALEWRSWMAFVSMVAGCWLAIAYLSGYAVIVISVIALGWMGVCKLRPKKPFAWISVTDVEPRPADA